jgi:hypothetical protein
VEGGEVGANEEKCCTSLTCPYDAQDDRYTVGGEGIRDLYLCDGCNKGFHLECIIEDNARRQLQWKLPGEGPWRCATCEIENIHRPSYIIDMAKDTRGRQHALIKWSTSESTSDSSTIPLTGVTQMAAGEAMLAHYRERLQKRHEANQDGYGKLYAHAACLNKGLHRKDTVAVTPSERTYLLSIQDLPYQRWKLLHPGSRPPIRAQPLLETPNLQSSMTRNLSIKQSWGRIKKWTEEFTIWKWYQTSRGLCREGFVGPGMEVGEFMSMLIKELIQWPTRTGWHKEGRPTWRDIMQTEVRGEANRTWQTWCMAERWTTRGMESIQRDLDQTALSNTGTILISTREKMNHVSTSFVQMPIVRDLLDIIDETHRRLE